ncbi:uncharacterized protein LOC130547502 [Triplophysa rosa]|uniref:uncharacterized protein LOC130547502 n=1 Tax=Triplophysa rosa TaxID=992332 RepID=UPI0025462B70|nr:uncharacterized protein LOC130547502 [Triplophysa rosa]
MKLLSSVCHARTSQPARQGFAAAAVARGRPVGARVLRPAHSGQQAGQRPRPDGTGPWGKDRPPRPTPRRGRSECSNDPSSAETPLAAEPEATPQTVLFQPFSTPSPVTVKEQRSEEFLSDGELPSTTPLPIAASPRAARTGPIKTGGRVFVLDHNRWPEPMRNAIDGLLAKHHGSKDLLKKVDAEYAAMVQSACTDPNSLLHPTTKQHISRYIKHLAKKKNTNASLNTSPEKLLETQQLWQRLHSGGETISVPVKTLPPAPFNPPAKSVPEAVPLDKAMLEKMVKDIVEKQQAVQHQQQQQQQIQKTLTRSCLVWPHCKKLEVK